MKKDNIQWLKDVSKAANEAGNVKNLGDAIGLPTAGDKEIIRKVLVQYDKANPGMIKFHRDAARARIAESGKDNKFGLINKESNRRYMMELPVEIGQFLEKSYPLMFTNKKHFAWFCKNFPELLIGEQY
jgi:hypothetical protein